MLDIRVVTGSWTVFQVRVHGRGGQGVVSGAEMLSVAAFIEGRYAQAFPSFGSERMGAPVMAFCRLDNKEIRLREPVLNPDALIIQDPTLLHHVDVFAGLAPQGFVLINTGKTIEQLGLQDLLKKTGRVATVPATEIALKHVGRAVPNAALLGGFAALSGEVKLASVLVAIRDKFPHALAEKNVAAAAEAYEFVVATLEACVA